MTDYITKQEFDEFKIRVFKWVKDNFEPKVVQSTNPNRTISEPLDEKLKKWKKPDQQKLIDDLPFG